MANLTLIRGNFRSVGDSLFGHISDMVISSGLHKCALIAQDTIMNLNDSMRDGLGMDRRGWDMRVLLSESHSESHLRLKSLRERVRSGEIDFVFVTDDALLSDMRGDVLDFPCEIIALVPSGNDEVEISDYGADVIRLGNVGLNERRTGFEYSWNWRGVEYDDNISLATAFAREKKIEKII